MTVNPPYQKTDDPNVLVVRHVKQCCYCQGSVDRFCSTQPDPHFHYRTLYFQCSKCIAMGDPVVGIMTPSRIEDFATKNKK